MPNRGCACRARCNGAASRHGGRASALPEARRTLTGHRVAAEDAQFWKRSRCCHGEAFWRHINRNHRRRPRPRRCGREREGCRLRPTHDGHGRGGGHRTHVFGAGGALARGAGVSLYRGQRPRRVRGGNPPLRLFLKRARQATRFWCSGGGGGGIDTCGPCACRQWWSCQCRAVGGWRGRKRALRPVGRACPLPPPPRALVGVLCRGRHGCCLWRLCDGGGTRDGGRGMVASVRLCLFSGCRWNGAALGERPCAAADVARGVAASPVHHRPAECFNAGR